MSDAHETAILAGGCFWGVQHALRHCPGVVSTSVGYTGGDVQNPTSRHYGSHAQAVEVIFAPEVTSFRALLEVFFQIHDPTTLSRQGDDIGTRYRSAIFYIGEDQKRVAEAMIVDIDASGLWPSKIVTEIVAAGLFWEAEPEHQDFLER